MLPWRASATDRTDVPATCSVAVREPAAAVNAVAVAISIPAASPISTEVMSTRSKNDSPSLLVYFTSALYVPCSAPAASVRTPSALTDRLVLWAAPVLSPTANVPATISNVPHGSAWYAVPMPSKCWSRSATAVGVALLFLRSIVIASPPARTSNWWCSPVRVILFAFCVTTAAALSDAAPASTWTRSNSRWNVSLPAANVNLISS